MRRAVPARCPVGVQQASSVPEAHREEGLRCAEDSASRGAFRPPTVFRVGWALVGATCCQGSSRYSREAGLFLSSPSAP